MKRIICFIDSLVAGGAQRQLVGLAKLLNDSDYEVLVLTYHNIPFYEKFLYENGVQYLFLESANNKWMRIPAILRFFYQWKPDVVVSYLDTPSIINCLSKFLGFKHKVVVSERNTTQSITPKEKLKFFFYKFADVIVPNSYSQENFIKKNFPRLLSKTTTITNFVDTDFFHPASTKPSNKVFHLISVGRIDFQKNIINFLKAIKLVKDRGYDIHIEWFGNKFPSYFMLCQEFISKLGVSDTFIFREASKNIKEEYLKADAFILPSLYEGFPNVICEAMACGLPILCSAVCDNPLLVKEGQNGFLFDPNDITEMADKICCLLNLDGSDLKQISENNRKYALAHLSSETFIEKYKKIL